MHPIQRVSAENQPITQEVEAVPALMMGEPIDNYGTPSVAWSVVIVMVAMPRSSVAVSPPGIQLTEIHCDQATPMFSTAGATLAWSPAPVRCCSWPAP
jgi:hypothetical protein